MMTSMTWDFGDQTMATAASKPERGAPLSAAGSLRGRRLERHGDWGHQAKAATARR